MAKKVVKIMLSMGLVLVLLSSSVLAVTGKVTGNTVRIREKASSNSAEISVATKGEVVEIIGEEGNWYHIKFEKVTGYISKDYVDTEYTSEDSSTITSEPANEVTPEPEPEKKPEPETTDPTPTTEPEPVTTVGATPNIENQTVTLEQDVNLRYLPNFSSRVHHIATSGSTYTVKESLNNWVKLVNETNSGWVLKNALGEIETIPVDTTPPENTETQTPVAEGKKGTVNVDSARIRKTPNGEVLDSISKGTEVTILSEEDDWYKINTGKYENCYIAKRLVTEK